MTSQKRGSAFEYLLQVSGNFPAPEDLSVRPDHYLYGGGYSVVCPPEGKMRPPRAPAPPSEQGPERE